MKLFCNKFLILLIIFKFLSIPLLFSADNTNPDNDGFEVVKKGGRVPPHILETVAFLGDSAQGLSMSDFEKLARWKKAGRQARDDRDAAFDELSEKANMAALVEDLKGRRRSRRRCQSLNDNTRPSAALETGVADSGGSVVQVYAGAQQPGPNIPGTPFFDLPQEIRDEVVLWGGVEVAARLALTCRGLYHEYGAFCALMTRDVRPLPTINYFSGVEATSRRWLWRQVTANASTLNYRGGWQAPIDFLPVQRFVMPSVGYSALQRLDLSLLRLPYQQISPALVALSHNHSQLDELVLDGLRFGQVEAGNFALEFEAFCTLLPGMPLTRLSLRRCGLGTPQLDVLMESLLGHTGLTLDLKGNYIRTLADPNGDIVDSLALVVEALNLTGNPLAIGSIAPLLRRGNNHLNRLYIRDTGPHDLPSTLAFLQAVTYGDQLKVLDIRDNLGMDTQRFVSTVLRHTAGLEELLTGMTGERGRPRGVQGPFFLSDPTDQMRRRSTLRRLVLHHDLTAQDIERFLDFCGNKRHFRHIRLEGYVDPGGLVDFFQMQLLQSLGIAHLDNMTPDSITALAEAIWAHPKCDALDLRSVSDRDQSGVHALIEALQRAAVQAVEAHEALRNKAREKMEHTRPTHHRTKAYMRASKITQTPYEHKLFAVKLPQDWSVLDQGTLPPWLRVTFGMREDEQV